MRLKSPPIPNSKGRRKFKDNTSRSALKIVVMTKQEAEGRREEAFG
jgi:hypothetical protein